MFPVREVMTMGEWLSTRTWDLLILTGGMVALYHLAGFEQTVVIALGLLAWQMVKVERAVEVAAGE